jgi:hypothetical protein
MSRIIRPADPDTTFVVSYRSDDSPTGYAHFFHVRPEDVGSIATVVARTRGETVYITPTGYPFPNDNIVAESVA